MASWEEIEFGVFKGLQEMLWKNNQKHLESIEIHRMRNHMECIHSINLQVVKIYIVGSITGTTTRNWE